jgi:uncharacterized protein (DUF427 family)
MQAIWNNRIIADSDDVIVVEGKHYFPFEAINHQYLEKSNSTVECPRKGFARYYTLSVNGDNLTDAAWSYTEPKANPKPIHGRVAFTQRVQVTERF